MGFRHALAAIALGLGVAGAAAAQPAPADAPGGSVLIAGARVFDGERLLGERDVLVTNGRIAAVGEGLAAPAGTTRVDGRGKTLLPGLMDSHVHVFPTAAADALRFGVTTEFDMFTIATPELVQARHAARAAYARVTEADVWSAGMGVTPPGGHPSQMARSWGVTIPTLANEADADAYIRARVAEGSDYIKIFQDDGAAHGGAATLTPFAPERLRVVIGAAQRADRRAIVHVSSLGDARLAIGFGANALAHMFQDHPADEALVAQARQHGVTIIPTLSVLAGASGDPTSTRLAADPAVAPHLSPIQRSMIAATFPRTRPNILVNALESVRRLHAAGVVILAGTDAPNPTTAHGPSMHEELELLVRAGMTPAEAISAATARPAAFFGTADRGRIAVGLRADLLLVEGDPLADITATRRIAGIWKNGFPVDRAAIPQMPAGN
ncbi:MAG TPA: amidohydrolase family protein [Allosphingosinicella sp.]|nr:amidohydrolase family protein [Allosphingosinicella sp.]